MSEKLSAVVHDLEEARKALLSADAAEQAARSHATEMRNRVSTLQAKFDAEADQIRKDAPAGTDWVR